MSFTVYSCVTGCSRTFDTPKAASNHRSQCNTAKKYNINLLDQLHSHKGEPPTKQRRTSIGGGIDNNNAEEQEPDTSTTNSHSPPDPQSDAQLGDHTSSPLSNETPAAASPKPHLTFKTLNPSRPATRSQTRLLNTGFRLQNDALPEGPASELGPTVEIDPNPDTTDTTCLDHDQELPTPSVSTNSRLPTGTYMTQPDIFGWYRIYDTHPLRIPDADCPLSDSIALPARPKHIRVNYTSYDVLRHQDLLNPSTSNRFIMLPAQSEDGSTPPHPFIYAKVLGVYHAQVSYGRAVPRREDFIHVRWLYYDTDVARRGRWDECRLDHIGYEQCCTDQDVLDSFDFIHPSDIIRAIHLIPDFQSGPSNDLLTFPKSIAHDSDEHWDWKHYYINRFVDWDILMRYLGGGIGHYRYTIRDPEGTLESEQNESENTEASLEMREEDENDDTEREQERSDEESEDEWSVGNGSICIAEDEVSDEEEPSIDEEMSEFGDGFVDDEMDGNILDDDEDPSYGF